MKPLGMSLNHAWHILIITLFILTSTKAVAGEFSAEIKANICNAAIYFEGKIEQGNSNAFGNVLPSVYKRLRGENKWCSFIKIDLFVNSDGGDLDESLKFGRLIRSNEIRVVVRQGGRCFSACVYLLAAGVERWPHSGSVGVHRPYFLDLPFGASSAQIRQKIDAWNLNITEYLNEMNVSLALHEDSKAIQPENIKILSFEEMEKYRIANDDAVYNEIKIYNKSKRYGISMAEYRKRDNNASVKCRSPSRDHFSDNLACREAIYLGISETEVKRRLANIVACVDLKTEKDFNDCYYDHLLGRK